MNKMNRFEQDLIQHAKLIQILTASTYPYSDEIRIG